MHFVLENQFKSEVLRYSNIVHVLKVSTSVSCRTDYCAWDKPWQRNTLLHGTLLNLYALQRICSGGPKRRYSGKLHQTLSSNGQYCTLDTQPCPPLLAEAAANLIRAAIST